MALFGVCVFISPHPSGTCQTILMCFVIVDPQAVMLLTEEQAKVRALLCEAITVLCKNGLSYSTEFSIEGLLGITVDNSEVFLISINESIKNEVLPEGRGSAAKGKHHNTYSIKRNIHGFAESCKFTGKLEGEGGRVQIIDLQKW